MANQIDMVNAQVQRGLMRVVLNVEGKLNIVPTKEGEIVAKCLTRHTAIRCMKCGKSAPVGMLPKYSQCKDCRKGTMPVVNFIERPA